MNAHPECYGAMFPDFTRLKRKERLEGQAFTALVMTSGTGAPGRNLEVKRIEHGEAGVTPGGGPVLNAEGGCVGWI